MKAKLSVLFLIVSTVLFAYQKKESSSMLKDKLNEIESYIVYRDSLNKEVSKVPISWHLDHTLITINKIYKVMNASDIKKYKKRFNFSRTILFTLNKIPRGRAESPDSVRPSEIIVTDSIYAHLKNARENINLIDSLPQKAHFTHPYVGTLNRRQAKKFLKIHTEHHLKIVRDILKQ